MKRYLEKIIIPFVCRKRKELGLQDNYPALAIYDGFRGQTTDTTFYIACYSQHLHSTNSCQL